MEELAGLLNRPENPSGLLSSASHVLEHGDVTEVARTTAVALGPLPEGSLIVWIGRNPLLALTAFAAAQRLAVDFLPARPDQLDSIYKLTKAAGLEAHPGPDNLSLFSPSKRERLRTRSRRLMFMTSGSTGFPKVVPFEPDQVAFIAHAVHDQLGYTPEDLVYSPITATFDYGFYQPLLCLLGGSNFRYRGTTLRPAQLLREIEESSATVLPLTPALARRVCASAEQRGTALDAVRAVTSTGAPLSPLTASRLKRVFPRATIQPMYGMTECKRISISPRTSSSAADVGSCGPPLPDTSVTITEPEGVVVDDGVGEIVVRGPHVAHGYWPSATGDNLRLEDGGWTLWTGDLGRFDEGGELHVLGRAKSDFVKVNDERVSLVELEEGARRISGVVEVRALAILDEDGLVTQVQVEYSTDDSSVDPVEVLESALGTQRPALLGRVDVLEVPSIDLTPHGKVSR